MFNKNLLIKRSGHTPDLTLIYKIRFLTNLPQNTFFSKIIKYRTNHTLHSNYHPLQ